jgi:predicted CopG family antitoxin
MTTTVQVADETRRLLEKLKKEKKLDSYDQVIRWLVTTRAGHSRSMFGAASGSHRFERENEDEHRP